MKHEERYTKYALAREMMETPDVIRNFKLKNAEQAIKAIQTKRKLFFTGEGSSRIFPAKKCDPFHPASRDRPAHRHRGRPAGK